MKKYSLVEIVPHYQPIVQLSNGKTVMYECLARFIDSNGSGIGPNDLKGLFEEPEFLWELFEKTLPKAAVYSKNKITISVNVDVCSFSDRFFYYIEHFLHQHPNVAEFLHFEVTENNIVKGMGELPLYIDHLRELGVKVVLDDFGTGGANLECLEVAKFDMVKIDGRFIKASAKSKRGYEKLQRIVNLLKLYDLPIVGEHIENKYLETIAKDLGIDYGQGYYYGPAAPVIFTSNELDPLPIASNQ